MFFKTRICRNKLHIYPEVEVYIAKQSPVELIALDCLYHESCLCFKVHVNLTRIGGNTTKLIPYCFIF